MTGPVIWQRTEGALVFAAAIAIYLGTAPGLPWWLALLLFLAPDMSFGAYALGPRIGAIAYNAVHIYGFGAAVLAFGMMTGSAAPAALGALWLAHSGFDRALGYGLKSREGFRVTHLGRIGGATGARAPDRRR